MEFEAPTIRHQQRLYSFFYGGAAISFHLLVVVSSALFCLSACGPCSKNRAPKPVDYDACGSHRDGYSVSFQDIVVGDISSGYYQANHLTDIGLENVCTNSNLFCFPSTLPDILSKEHKLESDVSEDSGNQSDVNLPVKSAQESKGPSNSTWLTDYGMFKLLNGRTASCFMNSRDGVHHMSSPGTYRASGNDISCCRGPLHDKKGPSHSLNRNSDMMKFGPSDGSAPHVEISPPLLDWGQNYLYFPSLAFLTVANTCNDSILHVYEPFSTDVQFYSCNSSKLLLGPGEVASICFVFLPRWLGLSSAHLILQTSSGGFLVQAKGFAVESPYGVQPLRGLDVSSSGRWSKNLSLFNPFDETLLVKELTLWVVDSFGDFSHSTEAICSVEKFWGADELSLLSSKDWLDVKGGQVGLQLTAMRPHRNWEIGPHSSESLMEMDFSFNSEGKVFGALCMQLLRSSQSKIDTVMLPLELDLGGRATYNDVTGFVSVSLEALLPCDATKTAVFAISVRNLAPYLLSVVKIREVTASSKLFQIKYVEGFILFPGTVTQVALITYGHLPVSVLEVPEMTLNCKLVLLTNDSNRPQIEIPCQDILRVCSEHQLDSYVGYTQPKKVESNLAITGFLGSSFQSPSEATIAEANELVLGSWKSQGTTSGMSVLDDYEVLFPTVQVGTHFSKWITVKNPSQEPVIMQLILNSGEIIDECRGPDGNIQPPSSNSLVHKDSDTPTKYGFSIGESGLTEAYVHPHGRAFVGPIFFHPSNRCGWRSSALIRNNLSGVEWLSLRGFGGLLSLVLLEGSEPIQSLEFNLNLQIPLNISPPDTLFRIEDTTYACAQPFTKELYAKNTGDLPLEVRRIEVSGTECSVDGFMVHTCKGFVLEPGESKMLLISYRTDFSTAMVHRDLELALANGIFVVPMKATLPMYMLNFCKGSLFWMRVKQSFVTLLIAASLVFLAFFCFLPQVLALGSQDNLFKSEKNTIATIKSARKFSRVQPNKKSSKLSVSTKMDSLLKSAGDKSSSILGLVDGYSDGQGENLEQGLTSPYMKPSLENGRQINSCSSTQKDRTLPSSVLSKSVDIVSSDTLEVSQAANLTIRIGKEKGRRRRKRKGAVVGLSGLFDVSSSQSGNSTPSSPLSPVASLTPKHMWPHYSDVDQSVEARNPFSQIVDHNCENDRVFEPRKAKILESQVPVKSCGKNCFLSTQEQPPAPRKTASKPVLLPSATFPCASRPASSFTASTSTISPHARAPGSKLYDQTTVKAKEKAGRVDEFTYDIWGDHFSRLQLMSRSRDASACISSANESYSDSFFVRGPQALMPKPQPRSWMMIVSACPLLQFCNMEIVQRYLQLEATSTLLFQTLNADLA